MSYWFYGLKLESAQANSSRAVVNICKDCLLYTSKRRKDGSFGWYSAKYSLICNWEGKPQRGIIACEDISEQYEKELAYQKWCQYFASQKKNRIGCYEYNLTQNSFDEASSSEPPFSRYGNSYTETMTYIAEYLVTAEDRDVYKRQRKSCPDPMC